MTGQVCPWEGGAHGQVGARGLGRLAGAGGRGEGEQRTEAGGWEGQVPGGLTAGKEWASPCLLRGQRTGGGCL